MAPRKKGQLGEQLKNGNIVQRVLFAVGAAALTVGGTPLGAAPAAASDAELEDMVLTTDGLKDFDAVSAPVITGTVAIGQTLEAALPEAWSPNVEVYQMGYQWLRDGQPIIRPGWDESPARYYRLQAADAGHEITVVARSHLTGYRETLRESLPVTPPMLEFAASPVPAIAGAARVGGALIAVPGNWSSTLSLTMKLNYQWYRSGVRIVGGYKSTYMLSPSDEGETFTLEVTGSAPAHNTTTRTSSATAHIAKGIQGAPTATISGDIIVGSTLRAEPGGFISGTIMQYQWYRSGQPIGGATARTYKLTGADALRAVKVQVTGSLAGYINKTTDSAYTSTISMGALAGTTPRITGMTQVGSVLSARTGSWTPGTTFQYQWYRSGQPINGAVSPGYRLTAIDAGKTLVVRVTGFQTGYGNTDINSEPTGAVAYGALAGTAPTISGKAKVGTTLTAWTGTWTSGTTFKYQWYRSGSPIKGATAKTYKITKSDRARIIKVAVNGSKTGYASKTRYSASTSRVG